MTTTDLTTSPATTVALPMADQWRFAETVAGSSILPRAYREDPGAVLVAVNLGTAMGLSPAESLYRIHVIEGRPSASAELITSNVRKAGHRLRIKATNEAAVAQIIRADDEEFVYEVTWTIEDARRAGLTGKDVWKRYPASMLRARAVTECARMACPEALYGVVYSTEEIDDTPARTAVPARQSAAALLADQPPAEDEPTETEPDPDAITPAQTRKLGALMREAGLADRASALAYVGSVVGRDVASRNDLTRDEASRVIDALANEDAAEPTQDQQAPGEEG